MHIYLSVCASTTSHLKLVKHGIWGYVVTLLDHTPIHEWHTTRLIVKNIHQKDVFHIEVVQCAHNIERILRSTVNTFGRICVIVLFAVGNQRIQFSGPDHTKRSIQI